MDIRIVRTRRRLQEALFDLTRERGIDQISVSDIAERAGVNRTTFYQHYSDRETLLADALDVVAIEAGAHLDAIDTSSTTPPDVLVDFLRHIEKHSGLYRQIFTEPGYGVALARLRRNLHESVYDAASNFSEELRDIPFDVVAAGVAGSVIGIIGAWLEGAPRASVEQAATWVWRLVLNPRGLDKP